MNQDVPPVAAEGQKKNEQGRHGLSSPSPTLPPQHLAYKPFVQHARYPPPPPPTLSSYHQCDLKHPSPIRPPNQPARIYKSCDPRDTQYELPPLSDSRYIVEDCGNASPRLLKPCVQILPQNSSIQQKTQIPMGVMCAPLAMPSEDYLLDIQHDDEEDHKECNLYPRETVPLVYPSFDEKEESLLDSISCSHCKAYWNPYMKFENKLDKITFHCNFCGKGNHTNVSNAFKPASALEFGTVDYDLGESTLYSENDTLGPIHVFAIDGNDREKFEVYLQSVAATVQKMDAEISMQLQHSSTFHSRNKEADEYLHHSYPRIGFFIYLNDEVLFPHWEWKRKSSFDEESYILTFSIMKDTEDPFSPIPITDWTFMLGTRCTTGLAKFYELIDHLPSKMDSFIAVSDDKTCGGSLALQVLLDALSMYQGATGTLISSSSIRFSTKGERSSKLNTGPNIFSQQKSFMISSNSDFFETCGRKASSHGLSINIIFCTSPNVIQHEHFDVGGIGLLLQQCNGIFKWIKYNSIDDTPRNVLTGQLVLLIRVSLTSVLEVHVACSEGLRILSSTANLSSTKTTTLSSISLKQNSVGTNSCFAVELGFRVGGIPITKPPYETLAFVQIITTLYTFGRRRLRISTLGMKVSQCADDVYSSVNADAMAAFLIQQTSSHVWKKGFHEIQKVKTNIEILLASLIGKLQSYRDPSNRESYNYLSLYQEGIRRSKLFAKEVDVFSRNRKDMDNVVAYNLILANLVSPSNALLFVQPAVYNLSNLSPFGNLISENISYVGLPESVSLNSFLNNEMIYLIDGYTDFFIYICRSVDADTRADLISINENGKGQRQLQLSGDSTLGKKIWRVIKQLQRCYKNSTYQWSDRPLPCGVSVVIASGGLGYREGFDSELENEIIALFNKS